MKESCHSKVGIFGSVSQGLLAALGTYAAAVIFELLMHLCVPIWDSGRKNTGRRNADMTVSIGKQLLINVLSGCHPLRCWSKVFAKLEIKKCSPLQPRLC